MKAAHICLLTPPSHAVLGAGCRSVCLEGLSQLQQLTSLTLTGTTLSKPTAWQQLGQLTRLQRLTCRLAAFEGDSLPELLHLTGCQQLRAVDMTLPCAGQHIRITCHHRVSFRVI